MESAPTLGSDVHQDFAQLPLSVQIGSDLIRDAGALEDAVVIAQSDLLAHVALAYIWDAVPGARDAVSNISTLLAARAQALAA